MCVTFMRGNEIVYLYHESYLPRLQCVENGLKAGMRTDAPMP